MGPTRGRRSPLESILRGYARYGVDRVAYGLMLMVLVPVVVAIAIAIFVPLGLVVFGVYSLIGSPGPPLVTVFVDGYVITGFVILFLVLRRGHRWLGRLAAIAEAPGAMIDPDVEEEVREPVDLEVVRKRLTAADARHAPPSDTHHEP